MNDNKDNKNTVNSFADPSRETGIMTLEGARHRIFCLNVIGQIEGHTVLPSDAKTTKYEHIIPALAAVEQDGSTEGLLMILNTIGGDVEAGLALAELVSGMSKPSVSLVIGGGHSIGIPLAVSADVSFIVPSATMTVHPVRTSGLVLGVPQTLDYFERMQKRITDFVTANSKIGRECFQKMMMNTDELTTDMGTVLDGKNAVECGLIDRLGGISDAINELYKLIECRK